jgi:hypothetical protein
MVLYPDSIAYVFGLIDIRYFFGVVANFFLKAAIK